jgi:hypothetical protein
MSLNGRHGIPGSLRNLICTALFVAVAGASLVIPFPSTAYAHPPGSVALAYDAQKKALSVTITHSSYFPGKHYIKSVEISQNGRVIMTTPYSSQPTGDSFTYTYPVAAAPGDELSVNATCNMFGSKVGKTVVPK